MKIKAIRHSVANTAEYQMGAPGDWFRTEELVADDYSLSLEDAFKGYELLSEAEWSSIRAAVKPAWDAWVASKEEADRQWGRQSAQQQLDVMETIATSSGALSAAQLSNAVRAIAVLMLKMGAWIKDQR